MSERATDPLVAEACRRSPLVWVRAAGQPARPVWSVWHEGAVAVVVGGEEQPDPVPDDVREVEVVVRSKAAGSRLLTFPARVEVLDPGDPVWAATVEALRAERLNAADPETLPQRWATGSRVLRLVPAGPPTEQPGGYDDASGASPPVPTPAVTVRRSPFHLGGRRRRR